MSESKGSSSNKRRAIFWLVFIAAAIYLIFHNIEVVGNILLVILGFGAVILVHEFGHFIAAKISGIKVEAFSIGFPPTGIGIARTEDGWRIRILPPLSAEEKEGEEAEGEEVKSEKVAVATFTIGKKGKAGETEYRIGLIPFGGYVKMLGQEDVGKVKSNDDPRSYANKPVAVRIAVLAAGVTFNAISAIMTFMIVFLIGINLPPAVIGGVTPGSPADIAGLRAGDEIIEIASKSDYLDFSNIMMAAVLSDVNEAVAMKVRHEDGTVEDYAIVAKQLPGQRMKIFGIASAQTLTIAELPETDAKKMYDQTGLMPGDEVVRIGDRDIENYWELEEVILNTFDREVILWAERNGKLIESRVGLAFLPVSKPVETEADLDHLYSMVPRLRITNILVPKQSKFLSLLNKIGIGKKDEVKKVALQKDDILLSVGDIENPTYKELREVTTEYEDKELTIKVLRTDANGVERTVIVIVVPRFNSDANKVLIGMTLPVFDVEHAVVAKTISVNGLGDGFTIPRGAVITEVDGEKVSSFYDIIRIIQRNSGQRISLEYRLNEEAAGSVAFVAGDGGEFISVQAVPVESIPFKRLERLYRASGPFEAIGMGYKKTVMFIVQTYATLKSLLTGLVSPKELMGPVGIVTLSYRIVADQPLIYYAYWLGLLSACIAVFNFLPLPPLDGGLAVILLVEKIKGSSLSMRTYEIVAYAGWVLIGTLLLYVTFNDLVRNFFS